MRKEALNTYRSAVFIALFAVSLVGTTNLLVHSSGENIMARKINNTVLASAGCQTKVNSPADDLQAVELSVELLVGTVLSEE